MVNPRFFSSFSLASSPGQEYPKYGTVLNLFLNLPIMFVLLEQTNSFLFSGY